MEEYRIKNKMERIMSNWKKTKPKTKRGSLTKILALCIPLAVIGIVGGIDYYLSAPISKEYVNLDGKGVNDDLRVTTRRGEVLEFIMKDGKYKLLHPGEKEAIEEEAREQFYIENQIPSPSNNI